MKNTAIFQSLIRSRPPDLAQVQRQNTRARFLFLLYSLLVSLATGTFAWFVLWKITPTDQWEGFWSASSWGVIFLLIAPVLVLLVLPAIALVRRHHAVETATRALPLREAAQRGDDTIAPLDSPQPTATESVGWAIGAPWQGRISRADASAQNDRLRLGGVLAAALAGYSQVAQGLALLLSDFGSVEGVIMLALLPFLVIGSGLLLWGLLTRSTMRVTATQDGLHWRQLHVWRPGTRAYLSWHEAQAFFTFHYSQPASSPQKASQQWRVYVLDAPQDTLAWKVSDSKAGHGSELATHEQLVGMILTQTRLPLRTLSGAAEEVASQLSKEAVEKRSKAAASASHEAMGLPSADQLHSRPRPRKGVSAPVLFVLPVVLLLVMPLAVWGVQVARAQYYETLLEQARAHSPLYFDALKHPTGDWPIQRDDGNYSGSFGYSGGAYQLTGGYGMLATTPAIYGDVLVEVTAHFTGDLQTHKYDDLGLALHTGDQTSAEVLFIVNSIGEWSIGPYPDAPIRFTGAVKGGLSTPNRLSVLMHGGEYICFINDTFVGLYQANQPGTGHVGVFYGGYALVASFNDFIVYPL